MCRLQARTPPLPVLLEQPFRPGQSSSASVVDIGSNRLAPRVSGYAKHFRPQLARVAQQLVVSWQSLKKKKTTSTQKFIPFLLWRCWRWRMHLVLLQTKHKNLYHTFRSFTFNQIHSLYIWWHFQIHFFFQNSLQKKRKKRAHKLASSQSEADSRIFFPKNTFFFPLR